MKAAGIRFVHVPYQGMAPAMNDLIGGHIDVMIDLFGNASAEHQGRQAQAARGNDAGTAPRSARRADDFRGSARICSRGVVCNGRSAKNAGRYHFAKLSTAIPEF